MSTDRQLDYIEVLGGKACRIAAKYLTVKQASALIDELKNPKEKPMTHPVVVREQEPEPQPVEAKKDPRRAMVEALLPDIPDAMYAVREFEGARTDFLRISRPKSGKYRGSIKVQTQHGSFGDGKYNTRAVIWPNGRFSVYDPRIVDQLLLLVADHRTAALLYAKESERCCRCNAVLTDERSRKYGIGPECEKHWPEIIEEVDEREAAAAS